MVSYVGVCVRHVPHCLSLPIKSLSIELHHSNKFLIHSCTLPFKVSNHDCLIQSHAHTQQSEWGTCSNYCKTNLWGKWSCICMGHVWSRRTDQIPPHRPYRATGHHKGSSQDEILPKMQAT